MGVLRERAGFRIRSGIILMSDAFDSSRRKLNWAKNHLANLKREQSAFIKTTKCEIFTELHPERAKHTICKMRLTQQVVPPGVAEMVGDVVDNLRSALDHAVYGIAVASGHPEAREAYFPFSRSASQFEANLKGRCRDVPKEIYPLLRNFEPYKGGSDALYALNAVCIANKHKLVIPCASATFSAGVNAQAIGYMEIPYHHTWDSKKNEMILCTLGPQTEKFNGKFGFAVHIAFGKIDIVGGKPIGPILEQFVDMVETILTEIEAETRRLGFRADLSAI